MHRWLAPSFAALCLLACGGSVASGSGGAGTSSSSSSSGSTSSSSSSSSSSGLSSSSSSSSSSGGVCLDCVSQGFTCCNGKCVNTKNDVGNCGACNIVCPVAPAPYCDNGVCGTPPCNGQSCAGTAPQCCGAECCDSGQLCCSVQTAGPTTGPKCYDAAANGGTCPVGCPLCK